MARFLGESKCGSVPNPKTDFAFFWVNPKTDHESIKCTLRVDSSDQIQIRIFEMQNLSAFSGKDLKKVFLASGFSLILSHLLPKIPCFSSIHIIRRPF